MRLGALVLLGAVACVENPSLRVEVIHAENVDVTKISVYELASLSCDKVAFADLDEEELATLLVAEQQLSSDGTTLSGDLSDISRTANKVIVARGYRFEGMDTADTLVTAGCQEHARVTENDSTVVRTLRIATASFEPNDVDPYRIGVLVTDRNGMPLHGRRVTWRMFGPHGSESTHPDRTEPLVENLDPENVDNHDDWKPKQIACTKQNGTIEVHPVPPDSVGGFAASVRVAWAEQAPILYTGITGGSPFANTLTIPNETKHPCAIRVTSGVKRLVCIEREGVVVVVNQYPVTVIDGRGVLGPPTRAQGASFIRPPVGLFSFPNGLDSRVYAIDTAGQLINVFNEGTTTAIDCPTCTNVVDFRLAPPCGSDPAQLFLKVEPMVGLPSAYVVPALGGIARNFPLAMSAPSSFELNNAGCVTVTEATGHVERQVAVFNIDANADAVTNAYYNCAPSCTKLSLPIGEAGVGFTASPDLYMIGTGIDATGFVLNTWGIVVDPETGTPRLVERASRVPTATRPNRISVGHFDTDMKPDLIWDITPIRSGRNASLEVAYAKEIGDRRLQAVSAAESFTVTDMFVDDVTDDGDDDIVIVAITGLAANPNAVFVIPTQRKVPVVTFMPDQCNPPPAPE